jgi:hypothetical protein
MDGVGVGRRPQGLAHWTRVLLALPFVAMLWVSSYNRIDPMLFGVPFFYWYQLLWVLLSAAVIGIVYKAEH